MTKPFDIEAARRALANEDSDHRVVLFLAPALAEIERLRRVEALVLAADRRFGHLAAGGPLPPETEPTPLRGLLDLARLVHSAAEAAKGDPHA